MALLALRKGQNLILSKKEEDREGIFPSPSPSKDKAEFTLKNFNVSKNKKQKNYNTPFRFPYIKACAHFSASGFPPCMDPSFYLLFVVLDKRDAISGAETDSCGRQGGSSEPRGRNWLIGLTRPIFQPKNLWGEEGRHSSRHFPEKERSASREVFIGSLISQISPIQIRKTEKSLD